MFVVLSSPLPSAIVFVAHVLLAVGALVLYNPLLRHQKPLHNATARDGQSIGTRKGCLLAYAYEYRCLPLWDNSNPFLPDKLSGTQYLSQLSSTLSSCLPLAGRRTCALRELGTYM